MPTFRTDSWPIPEGMNYSPEAKKASEERIKALRATAQRQALDRKIRQLQIDLPTLERDLNKGDAKAQIERKISRIEAVLNEFETDPWLSRRLNEYGPEFSEKLKVLRNNLSNLKSN